VLAWHHRFVAVGCVGRDSTSQRPAFFASGFHGRQVVDPDRHSGMALPVGSGSG
jgi:hypothetical protein